MNEFKSLLIRMLEDRSEARIGRLAGEMLRAHQDDKEVILAERDFHLSLLQASRECRPRAKGGPL